MEFTSEGSGGGVVLDALPLLAHHLLQVLGEDGKMSRVILVVGGQGALQSRDGFSFKRGILLQAFEVGKFFRQILQTQPGSAGLRKQAEGGSCGDGKEKVVRGGSWYDMGGSFRSSVRDKISPDKANKKIGFRLAMSLN